MSDHKYLIIGGGMTADAAVKGIRQLNTSDSIGVISSEEHLPYNRPPLSKALWKGEPIETVWRKTPSANVEIHLSRRVKSIHPEGSVVVDDDG
ncbi:MAG TPA: FAD/NAD(P)-binding oxidoreductase, partial [Saprospiraceae bacterium]|nr:FAD/NAD(P)-binding oxidoreductase [Saprospiraceae bacterium]